MGIRLQNGCYSAIETVLGIREIQNAIDDLQDKSEKYYQSKWQDKVEDVEELQELSEGITSIQSEIEYKDNDPDDSEVWELALQYADAGVEAIDQDISLKDEFDLLAFIDEADQKWE